jgi:hypothetical protein
MDDTQPQLQRGPEVHVYHYPPPVPCAQCGGAGSIALLVTARPCAACEGSGQVWPPARHEFTPAPLGYYRRKRSFDDQGRLTSGPPGSFRDTRPKKGDLQIYWRLDDVK